MVIVTSYENPDLDGIGGSVGYAELLQAQNKDAVAAVCGKPFVEARWVFDTFGIASPKQLSAYDIKNAHIALIDSSYSTTLPSGVACEQIITIIDHRSGGDIENFPNAEIQIEMVGAAATLVAERMKRVNVNPHPHTALLLLGGIISNTMNFCSLNTTDRDHIMHEWLAGIAAPPKDFAKRMFQAKTELILHDLDGTIRADGLCVIIEGVPVTQEQLEIIGVEKLISARHNELQTIMRNIKQEVGSKYALLNCIDVGVKTTDILVFDSESEAFYSRALQELGVAFKDSRAHLDHIVLRKQLIPLIKAALLYKNT